jgi:hypothetical protein
VQLDVRHLLRRPCLRTVRAAMNLRPCLGWSFGLMVSLHLLPAGNWETRTCLGHCRRRSENCGSCGCCKTCLNPRWTVTLPAKFRKWVVWFGFFLRRFLDHNAISGPIPDTLGGLPLLQRLDLSNNQLNGTIPQTLGDLRDLYEV